MINPNCSRSYGLNFERYALSFESLSRGELLELVTRQSGEISVLREINNRLKGHFEIDSLLREIMNYTKKILHSEACSLLLADEDSDQLFFYVTDDMGVDLTQIRLESGQGIVGAVYQSGEALIVNNAQEDPRFFQGVDDQTGFVTEALLCVPMSVGTRRIGVVEVLNRLSGDYTDEDSKILESIASQAALAIEYVRANEKRSFDERMAVVGNMAATVIHDLRNSMQVISGFSQLIAMEQPDQLEYCEVIGAEIDKLVEMSHEILEFSQGSSISVRPIKMSLLSFLRTMYELNCARFNKENCTFELVEYDDVMVGIDLIKMQRAVQNILNNALEALENNRKILLMGGLIEGKARIIVKDTGKGMDLSALKNVFKPFFTKGKSSGTGLGMAIVESIVKGHGGVVHVESELSAGSTFFIEFSDVVSNCSEN